MPLTLRRLLNLLPIFPGGRGAIYIRSSWHKPTQFDQWQSRPAFRPRPTALKADHFRRGLRRQRLFRRLFRSALVLGAAWIVWESVRALVA